MTEDELILRARQGDGDAVRRLYDRHASQVYTIVRRLAGDDALAEDWAQEAWVQALRALPEFRGDAQFGTWLYRIAVNRALQGRRERERRAPRELPLPELVVSGAREDRPLLRVRLERALAALPDRMRQVLLLHDVEGYTHEEMGELLGITAGTCKSQLFKARAKMREMLQSIRVTREGEHVCNT
jgi:RNA polymerase sigma-70 factor, ECF subfamily